jgi:hypothetical protein
MAAPVGDGRVTDGQDIPRMERGWQQPWKRGHSIFNGGERGIRTLGTAVGSTRDFQSRSFGQLGHLSDLKAYSNLLIVFKFSRIMAERVGFEPTCPAINKASRFRVDPVTTTSVPLRNMAPLKLPSVTEESLHQILARLSQNPGYDLQPVIETIIPAQVI